MGPQKISRTLLDLEQAWLKKREKYILEATDSILENFGYWTLCRFSQSSTLKHLREHILSVKVVSSGKTFFEAVVPIWLNKLFKSLRDFERSLDFFLKTSRKNHGFFFWNCFKTVRRLFPSRKTCAKWRFDWRTYRFPLTVIKQQCLFQNLVPQRSVLWPDTEKSFIFHTGSSLNFHI